MTDQERTEKRLAFIQGLRDCANFLEQRPTIDVPNYAVMNIFVDTKEAIAAHARAATWEKIYLENWFTLSKKFGDVTLEVNTARETVCRRVIKGKKIVPARAEHEVDVVEWECDEVSLLAKE